VLFEFDAGSELGDAASGNFEDTASLRVAPAAGFAVGDGKGAEAYEGDAVSFFERAGNGIDEGVNGGAGAGFADAGGGRDFLDQVRFVHDVLRGVAKCGGSIYLPKEARVKENRKEGAISAANRGGFTTEARRTRIGRDESKAQQPRINTDHTD
jgi:hypothetical protein